MAKRTESKVVKVGADLPAYMQEHIGTEDESLEHLRQYRVVPRVTVIQSGHPKKLKDQFGEGSCVILSLSAKVADFEDPFLIVPVFSFTEYIKWYDRRESKGPMERTFDPSHEIAKIAKNADIRNSEQYGDAPSPGEKPLCYSYVEHINFVCVVYDESHSLHLQPIVISFEKGEFWQGNNFSSALLARKIPGTGQTARMYSQVWELRTSSHTNGVNDWYGFDFSNPTESDPFVADKDYPLLESLYEDMKADHDAHKIVVDHEGAEQPISEEDEDDSEV